jgi:hypothetical protein
MFIQAQTLPPFKAEDQPASPDYSSEKNWIALPFRLDKADAIPRSENWVSDSLKEIDVFYIYPTLYMKGKTWCADVNDEKLNKRLANLPVKYQASVFNHVGKVYAPRYRQGIIDCFEDTTGNGELALRFAYTDVKRAFEYYLKNYNNGRPIVIASHSQGTRHSRQLLKDFFDTPEMKKKLVCAYTIGYGIYPNSYKLLKPCTNPNETNCYVTWASFKNKFVADKDTLLYGRVCVNPISWKLDTATAADNCGIMLNINKRKPYRTETRIKDNYLWVKTRTPFVQNWKVMHLVDFNLFWYSIRKNVSLRVDEYLKTQR